MLANILAMGATTTGSAATGAASGGGGNILMTILPFAIIIVIFYFLLIRPQKKKDKETKEMLASIKKGDKIATVGGIHGTIAIVKEETVIVKVDDNTRIEFSKNAIYSILDKKGGKRPEKPEAKSEEKGKIERIFAPKKKENTPQQPPQENTQPPASKETQEEKSQAPAEEKSQTQNK